MLQVRSEGVVHNGDDIKSGFVREIPTLDVMIGASNNLSLLFAGNSHPGFTDFSRLAGFYFHDNDFAVFFCNNVNFILQPAVIRGANSVS